MRSFSPVWSMIVDSSLWGEPDFVCKVFITMLAIKDWDDVCRCNAYQLAQRSKKSEEEVLEALRILSSPDKRRMEKQEFEGRRIKAVEDGWLVINGAKYRELMQIEMERARWRRAAAKKRAKEKALSAMPRSRPQPGETNYERMMENGASPKDLDRQVEGALPEPYRE